MSYYSFLICSHENHADVYFNGRPIGRIIGRQFRAHESTNADGSKREFKRSDMGPDFPYQTIEDFKDSLSGMIHSINLKEQP